MRPIIQLKHVSHVYVNKHEANIAIRDINLTVYEGEFVSLVGSSGCGKSTILSCIAGLIQPTEGIVSIDQKAIHHPSSQVGYMLQSDYLFEWRDILSNVSVGLEVMKKDKRQHQKYLDYLLQEMGLFEYKQHYPSQLSGGMRQRASLVRTLVTNPEILLLDEPFSALDYQTKLHLEDLVVETLKKHEKTAVLVTHDLQEAIAMSDKVVILDRNPGRIKQVVEVPKAIREEIPFHAREVEGFHELFQMIWKELDQSEN